MSRVARVPAGRSAIFRACRAHPIWTGLCNIVHFAARYTLTDVAINCVSIHVWTKWRIMYETSNTIHMLQIKSYDDETHVCRGMINGDLCAINC